MFRLLGKALVWLLVGLMNMVPLFSIGKVSFMGFLLVLLFMDRELVGFMDMVVGYFMACFMDWLMLELSMLL